MGANINSFIIDSENILHTFVNGTPYLTFENITSNEQAQTIIDGLNGEDERCFYLFESNFIN